MGRLQPTKSKAGATAIIPAVKVIKPCDHCGFSKIDGKSIANAVYQVDTPAGTLYFCNHHFTKHSGHIISQGYDVKKIA